LYLYLSTFIQYLWHHWLMTTKSRSRREYLIPTDNIIVLAHFFKVTKKSNLIGRLYYDFTQFFDNLVTYILTGV